MDILNDISGLDRTIWTVKWYDEVASGGDYLIRTLYLNGDEDDNAYYFVSGHGEKRGRVFSSGVALDLQLLFHGFVCFS